MTLRCTHCGDDAKALVMWGVVLDPDKHQLNGGFRVCSLPACRSHLGLVIKRVSALDHALNVMSVERFESLTGEGT